MITPRQFLECFLQDKATAWAEARRPLRGVYHRYFGVPLSQHTEHFMPRATAEAEVEDVRQADGRASAVTREHFVTADIRTRYRLVASGASWRIIGIDRECFICRGKGESVGFRCQKCHGERWYDCTTNVA
jgi:hypothetical protein